MTCNLLEYLKTEELSCRRIARTATEGSQQESEWRRVAELLWQCRKDHVRICQKCSKDT